MASQDANIKLLIESQVNTTKAIADLQSFANQAKTEAKNLNKVLEAAFTLPSKTGRGGGIFGSMLQSIKEMNKSVNTVSTTMRESMGEVKGAVDSVKDSIMALSDSIKGLTGKKHKVQIEQEIVTKGGTVLDDAVSDSGGTTGGKKKLPANLLSARGEITQKISKVKNPSRAAIESIVRGTKLSTGKTIGDAFNKEVINRFIDKLTMETAAETSMGIKNFSDDIRRWASENRKGLTYQKIRSQLDTLAMSGGYSFGKTDISPAVLDKMAQRVASAQMVQIPDTGANKFKETIASKEVSNILRTRLKDVPTSGVSVGQSVAAENILASLRGVKGSKGRFKINISDLEKLGIDLTQLDTLPQFKQMGQGGRTPQEIKEEIVLRFTRSINRQLDTVARKIIKDFESQQTGAPSGPELKGQFSRLPKGYLDQARWKQGSFKSGDAFISDAKAYMQYAIKDLGMSLKDVLSTLKMAPEIQSKGSYVNPMFGMIGAKSEQGRMLQMLADYGAQITGAKRPVDEMGKSLGIVNDLMRKQGEAVLRLGRYYTSFFLITSSIQQMNEMWRQSVLVQEQMLELQKFLPQGSNVGALRGGIYNLASDFGVPIDTVLGAYTEFAKQGKQANEIIELTRAALLGVNVASTDFGTTVTYLTTVTNVWKDQFSDTTRLIDKLAIVQAKSSASSEVLISAMQRSASMAKAMGVSIDQLFGYIGAVSEKTQLSGEVIGTSLRTIFERSRRDKTINMLEAIPAIGKAGLRTPITQELASAPQILELVAQKWDKLTDVQQRNIAFQMAGGRQINSFMALMENMGRASELTANSIDSLNYAFNANNLELEKFSKSFESLRTRTYELATSAILPSVKYLSMFMNAMTSVISLGGSFNKLITGMSMGAAAFSVVSVLASRGLGLFIKALAIAPVIGTAVSAIGGIIKSIITLNTTALMASSGMQSMARSWGQVARGFSQIGAAGYGLVGVRNILSGFGGLLGPIGLAVAAIGTGIAAWNSSTESTAEKQQVLNEKLQQALNLHKQINKAQTESSREDIAYQMSKDFTTEEFSQKNFPAEWSKKYNRYIFPFSSAEELKAVGPVLQGAKVSSVEQTAISDKALGQWLNAFMPQVEKALGKEFISKPDELERLLKLLYESTGKTTAAFAGRQISDISQYPPTQSTLKYLRNAQNRGIEMPLSPAQYLLLKQQDQTSQTLQELNAPIIEKIFSSKLLSSELNKALESVKPISFNKLFDGKGIIEEISRYRSAFATEEPAKLLDAEQQKQEIEKYKKNIDEVTFLKRKQYEEEAKAQRDNLAITRSTSNAQMSEMIVGLKDIAKLKKQLRDEEIKAKNSFYEGATGEEDKSDEKIENIKKELIAGQKALSDITGGKSPTDIAKGYMEFIKKTLSSAPAESVKIYEDWAMNQVELLKNSLKASVSAGQVDETMSPDIIKRNLNIQMMSDQFQQEIMATRKAREDALRAQQLDIKYAKDVYLSVVKYGMDVDKKIQEYVSRPNLNIEGMSRWIQAYDQETKNMTELMQSREQVLKENQDKISAQEAAKERAKIQEMKGQIEKRTSARGRIPGIVSLDSSDTAEFTKFALEQGKILSDNIEKGISPNFLNKLNDQIEKVQFNIMANQAEIDAISQKGLPEASIAPLRKKVALLEQEKTLLSANLQIAEAYQYRMAPAEAEKQALDLIAQKVDLKRQEMSLNGELLGTASSLLNYNIAEKEIHVLKNQLLTEQERKNALLLQGKNTEANKMDADIQALQNLIGYWEKYRDSIYNVTPAITSFSSSFLQSLQNIQQETQTGISFIDNLSSRLYALAGQVFNIAINFVISKTGDTGDFLGGIVNGVSGAVGKAVDFTKRKSDLEKNFKKLDNETKKVMAGTFQSAALANLQNFAKSIGIKEGDLDPNDPRVQAYLKQIEDAKKTFTAPDQSGARAAQRDRESTAHYNALERLKKAEADFQKQQQMSSYWEAKMPDKYMLKYDAETRKYQAELQAKQAALDSERANLKPEEVKRYEEEIAVLDEKVKLQGKYKQQAQEIAAFEKWQSDNRVGLERLRTELSLKTEMYEMEYAAIYSPSRAEEKAYMEWKIKAGLTELEAQRIVTVEEQRRVAMKNGMNEADAMALALSTEEVQLLDIKIQKEQALLGLVDRQLELKQKQKINEQVREVQGILSSGIFDALSLKSRNEQKKQIAEIAKELSKLGTESETASYGIAQAESMGNIDAINSARDKWNEVNKQIDEARKKMDEVKDSTNKWKEVLQNIGDSVLKKLADKFAEMLINKTGLGDMLGMVFGGIDGINTGGKGVKGQALPAAGSALAALSLKSPQQSLKMAQEMMGLMVPGSSGSTNYNVSVAGGAGNPLGALLGGGLKFGGAGTSALGGGFAGSKLGANAGFGKTAASTAAKYGTAQYLTSAMLGYAIGSSTSNRAVGVLGGAAAGFLTGGPVGAILGAIGGLFGRKKGGDEAPPPPPPPREFYPLFANTNALDRNTSALMRLSDGVFGAPSVFEVNKLQAERNMTAPVFNITINAASNSPKAIASEVNAAVSNAYQSSMGKMSTSTSNWG